MNGGVNVPTIKTEHEYNDPVNYPKHYTSHPSGIECIQIIEHMGFCLGSAVKYIWRADLKGGIEDLEKAIWQIQREIAKRRGLTDTAANAQTMRYSMAEQAQQQVASSFINSLAAQGGQIPGQGGLKGDFESFKEYIDETSSYNKTAQSPKRS